MSDTFITFLRITSDEAEAVAAVDSVVAWLLEEGIIADDPNGDDFHGQFKEGPNHARVFTEDKPDQRGFGLKVEKGWSFESNFDGFEWPPCPRCGEHLPEESTKELVFGWIDDHVEPTATCPSCGHTDLLGNFEHVWSGYCAHASFSFVNSWSLNKDFERELLQRIGGRSRVLYVLL